MFIIVVIFMLTALTYFIFFHNIFTEGHSSYFKNKK